MFPRGWEFRRAADRRFPATAVACWGWEAKEDRIRQRGGRVLELFLLLSTFVSNRGRFHFKVGLFKLEFFRCCSL